VDIAVFDNHRILHGRTDLTVNGRRWLQWIQVERGDFHSTLRITADRLQQDRSIDPLLRGAYS
ncbi:MAG: taurine catabolism dioxygenase TauD, partial [Rhodospirillales bacterium]|nr:taurine catabolism dioxygenase TauD [Rhodospirillales bacterium]